MAGEDTHSSPAIRRCKWRVWDILLFMIFGCMTDPWKSSYSQIVSHNTHFELWSPCYVVWKASEPPVCMHMILELQPLLSPGDWVSAAAAPNIDMLMWSSGSPFGDYFFLGLKKWNKLMISHLHPEIIRQIDTFRQTNDQEVSSNSGSTCRPDGGE